MIFEILISILFISIVGIQTLLWCQIIVGAIMHYKVKKTLKSFILTNDNDDYKGYA